MMNTHPDLVVIGQLTLDDLVKFDQLPILDSPGGSGLYALAGVSLWDTSGKLGFITRLGNDYHLEHVFEGLRDRLDIQGVKRLPAPSIHIWSMFDRKGNRYFILQRWGSYDDVMGIYPEDIPPAYQNSGSFLVAAFPFDWQSRVIEALPADKLIAVDPHFQGVYPQYRERWYGLLKKINVFLPSEEELLRFFSIPREEALERYLPFLKELSTRGPEVVCVKLGERGALLYDRTAEKSWHVPPCPVESVVDVTGCGDAFCGGFMASYARDRDAFQAAMHGAVSASFNLEDYGVLHNYSVDHRRVKDRFEAFSSTLRENAQQLQGS